MLCVYIFCVWCVVFGVARSSLVCNMLGDDDDDDPARFVVAHTFAGGFSRVCMRVVFVCATVLHTRAPLPCVYEEANARSHSADGVFFSRFASTAL